MDSTELDGMLALAAREHRLTERCRSFRPVLAIVRRLIRRIAWARSCSPWAGAHTSRRLPARIIEHESSLFRRLGDTETQLPYGEVQNLLLSSRRFDGLLIRPGEAVSFNRIVGNLAKGDETAGAGLCQLANLIHWMVLHSSLTVTESSACTTDPFPGDRRAVPWGADCAIVYNYVDLCFRNDTDITFAISVAVRDRSLAGELRSSAPPAHSYRVFADGDEFLRLGNDYFRRNEIWRAVLDRRTGECLGEELVRRNCALVRYVPTGGPVTDLTPVVGRVVEPRPA